MRTTYPNLILIVGGISLLAACSEERPPRSTTEFVDNRIMLEAAMVRCAKDRAATRYDAECVNAREAVRIIETKEEAARKAELDARSESKRRALRRTQEAASQARRRVAEDERQRKEAEYLAQFGVDLPPADDSLEEEDEAGNLPMAVIPESTERQPTASGLGDVIPATDGGNAPVSSMQSEEEDPQSDLESVRDELQRRNEEGGN